jgi:hypothetical protein
MRQAGLANLKAVAIEKTEQVVTEDGASFRLVTGQSVYTASLALILPEVLGRLGDVVPGPHGVLACVPACRHLAVHVIRDESVLASLQLMALRHQPLRQRRRPALAERVLAARRHLGDSQSPGTRRRSRDRPHR